MPEYLLDFGPVIAGVAAHKTVRITNVCCFPVSFVIDQSKAVNCGFSSFINNVTQLPPGDSVELIVAFCLKDFEAEGQRIESELLINVSIQLHVDFDC